MNGGTRHPDAPADGGPRIEPDALETDLVEQEFEATVELAEPASVIKTAASKPPVTKTPQSARMPTAKRPRSRPIEVASSSDETSPTAAKTAPPEALAIAEPLMAALIEEAPPVPQPPLVESVDPDEARALLAAPPLVSEDVPPPPDVADLPPAELRAVIEALLFVSTRPLSVERLTSFLPGADAGYLDGFLAGLAARFDHEGRGWELRRLANGWQLLTRREHHAWVRQLERKELPTKLSKSALETLAIVAYQQPVTRGKIEDIRGVQCGPVLRQLMDLKLVQVTGRDEDTLGRPLLYGTTDVFLVRFGLGALGDLPAKHEFGA